MKDNIRLLSMVVISLFVIITGALFVYSAFMQGEIAGGIFGAVIALIILAFAMSVFIRGSKDLKKGLPLKDERSRRVMEKASSRAFYISLYMLLAIGFFSDRIPFRDISQATGLAVGLMALLFAGFWIYYNKKEM
ncbi:DUF2178 domain-containing protein [Candidatus Woesearchaeota archaeon]|nr:DUF2178 domain-containing protein [Candidatus Woesearchaeota archaeon]